VRGSTAPLVCTHTPRNLRAGKEDLSKWPLEWLRHYLPHREHNLTFSHTLLSDDAKYTRTGLATCHGCGNQFDLRRGQEVSSPLHTVKEAVEPRQPPVQWYRGSFPVAARSEERAFGRSFAGIVGSNPTGGMAVCLLWVLCVVR
jgi:hypothetical protein